MMDEKKNDKGKKFLRSAIVVVCSAFAGSAAQIFVMIPNGLTSGGLPGIVRIITHFMPWNYSLVYYCFGMAVVLLVYFTLGWKDVQKIIALSIAYPVIMYGMEQVDFCLLSHKDPFLASVLVGVLYGTATGIGYIDGFSSGGTDSIARVIKFRLMKHVPIGRIMLFLDGSVIVMSAFVFDRNVAFYALVTVFITSKITESILLGISGVQVSVAVITKEPQLLVDFVMHEMHRGVTTYTSTGEYTKTERRSVQIICSPRESLQIKSFLAEHDEHAFVTVTKLSSVWGLGRGFSDIHEVDNN